jgi:hypothetical protein
LLHCIAVQCLQETKKQLSRLVLVLLHGLSSPQNR